MEGNSVLSTEFLLLFCHYYSNSLTLQVSLSDPTSPILLEQSALYFMSTLNLVYMEHRNGLWLPETLDTLTLGSY